MRRRVAALGVLALLLGCEPEPRTVEVRLVAPEALGCRATSVTAIRAAPLGDFPTEARPTVDVDPEGGPLPVERFPRDTVAVRVEADGVVRLAGGGTAPWRGGGLGLLDVGDALVVPMLRYGRGCALADPSARVPDGAVALALDDGRLLVAGGEGALSSVVTVRPGIPLAAQGALRLFTPRRDAGGATLDDGRVVVLGGAVSSDGGALDTVEVLRVVEGEEGREADGFLTRPRAAPAVVRLGDAVLVVGGRDAAGAIGDVERLEIDGDDVIATALGAAVPRWGAAALALDDGTALVVGGASDAGPSGAVERFDGALERVGDLEARDGAAWVALPGGRAARIGGRDDGGWSRAVDVWIDGAAHAGAPLPETIEAPAAVALLDGRVLVTGSVGGERLGWVVDPGGAREPEPVTPSRVEARLTRLVDGTVVEADAAGASLLRVDAASPFDDPQASLFPAQPEQRAQLRLDAPDRWRVAGDRLEATVDGARLDLPTSRFLTVRVELEVTGDGALLLDADGAPAVRVELDGDTLRAADCTAPRPDAIVVERTRDGLRLGDVDCPALAGGSRVALGLALDRGASVRRIAVTRTAP